MENDTYSAEQVFRSAIRSSVDLKGKVEIGTGGASGIGSKRP
jgi:hypothetical protein